MRTNLWIRNLWILMGLLLATESAYAIPSLFPRIRDKEVRIALLGNSYLSTTRESLGDQKTGNLGLNVGVRGIGNRDAFHFGVEADSLYGLRNANYRYLDVGEAYLGYDNNKFSVYVGRKRYPWSVLDTYWGLGLFQPRFRWDYLNERENGLFGAFAGYETDAFSFTLFGSAVNIPEQGAPFDIDGGDCRSSSPWFSCPSSTILIFNQDTDINYRLDIPPLKKIIVHSAVGGTARIGKDLGPFARLSYIHKPMNQLILSYEGRLNIATDTVPAIIRPRVLYHDLYSMDLGWNIDVRNNVTGSVILERPERDVTPSNWNTQEVSNATLSGIVVKTMPFRKKFYQTRFELAYFRRDGGTPPDKGPFVQPGQATFEPRFAFQNAFSFAVFTPIVDSWARRFLFTTKFIVDTANTGNILMSDAYYSPFARTFLNVGIDIIGSNSTVPVDFTSRYQRNDRLRGGIAYVF